MNPRARRDVAADLNDPLLLTTFLASDGTRSVAEIAALAHTDEEDVFAALDKLGDLGLLEARVAPPALSRRFSRRQLVGGIGVVAAGVAALFARKAEAAEPTDAPAKEQKRKAPVAHGEEREKAATSSEQKRKRAAPDEQREKAPAHEERKKSAPNEERKKSAPNEERRKSAPRGQKKASGARDEQNIKHGASPRQEQERKAAPKPRGEQDEK